MVARRLESSACSANCSIRSRCLPLRSPARPISSSTVPNCASSFCAVLSPMPGTPGMLSTESPTSASTSTTCETSATPQRSRT